MASTSADRIRDITVRTDDTARGGFAEMTSGLGRRTRRSRQVLYQNTRAQWPAEGAGR